MQYFYMMVGLPGSGKSYYAQKLPDVVIHSSDAIREELLGNISDQSNQELVFQTLHDRVLEDLRIGKNVVYDATNINFRRRQQFLSQVRALRILNLNAVCVFTAAHYSKCLENNAARERTIPESVIKRMYENFDIPMMSEGWDEIWIENDYEWGWAKWETTLKRLSAIEHDNPHHEFTIGQHCLAAWAYLLDHYPDADIALKRAVILHDIGKEHTKVFHDSYGEPTEVAHYYHHERVGAYDSFAYTGDLSTKERLDVALLIRWHMYPYVVSRSDNPQKTMKKIVNLIGEAEWNRLLILNECDLHAH